MRQESIFPGQPWLDTNGNAIQAHGGAVYYEDGVYYWYGEDKEYTDGASDVWTWGIKVYSSRDLCNWQDDGYLVEPDVDDPASPLHPSKRVDRPHILRSANGTLCAVAEAVRERRLLCRTVIGAFAGSLSDGKSLSAAGGRRGG